MSPSIIRCLSRPCGTRNAKQLLSSNLCECESREGFSAKRKTHAREDAGRELWKYTLVCVPVIRHSALNLHAFWGVCIHYPRYRNKLSYTREVRGIFRARLSFRGKSQKEVPRRARAKPESARGHRCAPLMRRGLSGTKY